MFNRAQQFTTIAGAFFAILVYSSMKYEGMENDQSWTAAVTVLCAVWWLCESLPIPATSLVPFAVFPLVGVLNEASVARAYGHPLVLLFLGGFMLSRAAEDSGAHRRIAEAILRVVGATSGRRLVFGFMLATAVCSMWISNTATALMMLPVVLAVIEHDRSERLAVPLLLGIGYAATIGGMATPIGSPPNGVCIAQFEEFTGEIISFPKWMSFGVPVMVLMFITTWGMLTFHLSGVEPPKLPIKERWTSAQRRTLGVFGFAAMAWITREMPFGGWSKLELTWSKSWLDLSMAGDTTVALLAALALFLIPSGDADGKRLLDWPAAAKIPWGVLLLFGGGIAIAEAFQSSGLSQVMGTRLAGLRDWPVVVSIGAICLGATFFSEIASNTAAANVLLPVLGATAKSAGIHPALLMIPAGLAVSCGFMLPVATPPNAIVFGTGRIRMKDMALYGFALNLVGSLVITLVSWWLLPLLMLNSVVK